MRLLRILAIGLSAASLITGCSSCGSGQAEAGNVLPPPPVAADRPSFDRSRAFSALVTQCDFGPREPGSQGHEACRRWLVQQLQAVADKVHLQSFNSRTPMGGPFDFQNIVGLYEGTSDDAPLLLGAHWDTRPIADEDPDEANTNTPILGANDGASGVAVLLELARLLKQHPPARPVMIAFFDAEDSGVATERTMPYMGFCIGSNYLANNWPANELPWPEEMILLDLVGTDAVSNPRLQPDGAVGAPQFSLELNSLTSNPALVEDIWSAAEALGHTAFVRRTIGPVTDDHKPFIDKGVAAVDIIHFSPPPAEWHTIDDTPDHCSAATLFQVGDTLVDVIWPGWR